MTPIFSEKGYQQLDKIIRKGVLCAFDFDGTLAPIVARPGDARLPAAIAEKLVTLSKLAPIAILTGRAIEDILPRLPFVPDYLVGNHGLEGIPGWEAESRRYRELCSQWNTALEKTLPGWQHYDNNILIENKTYSLAIHYRHAATPETIEKTLPALLADITPNTRIVPGKCMVNLVPDGAPDKGSALTELMNISRAPSVIYVGDDVTDEDVFRLQRDDLLSIRVEKGSSAAVWYIKTHEDIGKLLDTLIHRLQSL